MISWMLILGLVGIQLIMAIRIIPVYMNHSSLVTIMDSLPSSPDIQPKNSKKVMEVLKKKLKINNLYDLAANKEAFTFKKIDGGFSLVAHYEARGPIFKNLEFVATFDHSVDFKK